MILVHLFVHNRSVYAWLRHGAMDSQELSKCFMISEVPTLRYLQNISTEEANIVIEAMQSQMAVNDISKCGSNKDQDTMHKLSSLFSRKYSKQRCDHCQGSHKSIQCESAIKELEDILLQLDSHSLSSQSVVLSKEKEFEMDMAQIAASTHKQWYQRFVNQDFSASSLA
ncbi:hypothetical protein K7432_000708 [Basidiobolus ranarum]|uniref:Uncharacterized protein n=1 Tax=Basidiobolus ranarum TaxID=34480 RepID=A0ABR2X460_9FUNG